MLGAKEPGRRDQSGIRQNYRPAHGRVAEAADNRLLIEMLPVRLEDIFALHQTPNQGDRGVGQIICRKDQTDRQSFTRLNAHSTILPGRSLGGGNQ